MFEYHTVVMDVKGWLFWQIAKNVRLMLVNRIIRKYLFQMYLEYPLKKPGFNHTILQSNKKFAIKTNFFSSYLVKAGRSYLPRNITSIRKNVGLFSQNGCYCHQFQFDSVIFRNELIFRQNKQIHKHHICLAKKNWIRFIAIVFP